MTGEQHYAEAERLLRETVKMLAEYDASPAMFEDSLLMGDTMAGIAHAHATLALAAATGGYGT